MKKFIIFLLPSVITATIGCNNTGSKEITILYTNDVHGAIDYDDASSKILSYATVAQMKKDLKQQGKKVLLFDCGDHTSGGLYCSYLNGLPIVNIMNSAGYDAAIFGNHEFDHSFQAIEAYEDFANFPYIATNLYHCSPEDQTPISPYTNTSYVFNLGSIKIGVIGVSTPYSMTTSTPSYFQDENGNYIYSFLDGNDGQDLYDAVQEEVDTLRNDKKCNYVICLAHMGNEELDTHIFASSYLAKYTSGIDVILDGHSHVVDPGSKVKNKNNEDVLITQTGSSFKNIGKLTISSQGEFTNELIPTYQGRDKEVERLEKHIIDEVDKEFGVDIATSEINFVAHDEDGNWQVRRSETNLGDLSADAYYYVLNYVLGATEEQAQCDVTIINSGSVRNDVPPRTWKLLDCRSVHMFDNNIVVKTMKGATLKTYLEFVTREYKATPEETIEVGGFAQVQGIKFQIDVSKPNTIVIDEKGNYVSGPTKGMERVYNIEIFDKENNTYKTFDENKDYKVGGSAYVLEECGDGCSMFKNVISSYRNSTYVDYLMLAEYIKSFKNEGNLPKISSDNSPLKDKDSGLLINYEQPNGSGRFLPLENYGI